jgi:hypothetical protein
MDLRHLNLERFSEAEKAKYLALVDTNDTVGICSMLQEYLDRFQDKISVEDCDNITDVYSNLMQSSVILYTDQVLDIADEYIDEINLEDNYEEFE